MNLQLKIVLKNEDSLVLNLINIFPNVENIAAIIINIIGYLVIRTYLLTLKHLA